VRFHQTLILSCALSLPAWASTIVYTLDDVTLSDGGTATGSFSFNADSGTPCGGGTSPCGTYGNVHIVTTSGSSLAGTTYTLVCGTDVATCNGVIPNSTEVLFLHASAADETGLPAIVFFFTAPGGHPPGGLSDSGGAFNLNGLGHGTVQEAFCADASCSAAASPLRVGTAGTATSLPEPSSGLLVGLALAGLSKARRCRKLRPHS